MIYRKIIIIVIFYILDIVVLTTEIVSATDIVLTIEIVSIEDPSITFRDIVIVLTIRFVLAKMLFIVSVVEGD